MRRPPPAPLLALVLLALAAHAGAAVGLVTVPERDTVRMTIYNAVDLTLVQERRTLTVKKGLNRIQYQWAGTLIDATSLELRPTGQQADIEILNIVYPPNAPATLVWEIESRVEGPVPFEISYFTSGLGWQADYVLRASSDESTADLEGWVAVSNASGEDYPKAEVRLVVGSINLVEQIRDLATGQLQERTRTLDKGSVKSMRRALAAPAAYAGAVAMDEAKAPEVVSARLADYHIFTISGVQAVSNGATTRFLAIANAKPMPIEVLYRVAFRSDAAQKLYRFVNDTDHFLPDGPIPDGTWHVFRVTDAKERSLSFSGATVHPYAPPRQKVELDLGADPGVAVKQVHEWRGQGDFHFDNKGRLDGWVEHERFRFKLVNTKSIPVAVEYLVHADGGDWSIDGLDGERRDQQTFRHQDRAEPGKALELGPFTITMRRGERSNAPNPPKPPLPVPLPRIESVK